ncbi:MAG: nuclear transport factor 2 family protein [Terracidiphilus sp.]
MSESAEGVVEAFVRAINRQDVEALAERMTEEHRFVDSLDRVVEGRDAMRAAWKGYFALVPDYTIVVEETFCDGPIVVLLGTAQGTYAGGGQLTPENHWETPVALRAFVEDGKVAAWRVYADNEPMRRLMGRGEDRE